MRLASAGGYAGDVLALMTEALDVVAAGKDPRPLVCSALAGLLEAEAAGYAGRVHGSPRVFMVGETAASSPDALLALDVLRRVAEQQESCWVASAPGVDEHVAWLPVPPAGREAVLHVFVRADGFCSDALALLQCAQAPAGAVERVFRRTLPLTASARTLPLAGTGRPPADLTAREREVLRLLSEGLLARTIAARLEVSPRTIHHHLGSIYDKLGVRDRLSAALRARSLGLLDGAAANAQSARSAEVTTS
jgi:DNA-binding CsgD family transcriptional regulator